MSVITFSAFENLLEHMACSHNKCFRVLLCSFSHQCRCALFVAGRFSFSLCCVHCFCADLVTPGGMPDAVGLTYLVSLCWMLLHFCKYGGAFHAVARKQFDPFGHL